MINYKGWVVNYEIIILCLTSHAHLKNRALYTTWGNIHTGMPYKCGYFSFY
jgi:hypothetical protein